MLNLLIENVYITDSITGVPSHQYNPAACDWASSTMIKADFPGRNRRFSESVLADPRPAPHGRSDMGDGMGTSPKPTSSVKSPWVGRVGAR